MKSFLIYQLDNRMVAHIPAKAKLFFLFGLVIIKCGRNMPLVCFIINFNALRAGACHDQANFFGKY